MRLTLVIASLTGGGAERVMAVLANAWSAQGHVVTLMTIARAEDDRQPLAAAVTRVGLDMVHPSGSLWQSVQTNLQRVIRLRQEVRRSRPDVVVSFLAETNVLTLCATRGLRMPVIVSERVDPSVHPLPVFWSGMRALVYRSAAAVVVQTPAVARWAEHHVAAGKVHAIPNPVSLPGDGSGEMDVAPRQAWRSDPRARVFAMGRLTRQKGFDVLLEAFALCRPENRQWSLVIFGEGEERGSLEALARSLGIDAAVTLPGYVRDAGRALRTGDLFVLPSRYEGFPNALLEAMACGLPVISSDCPSGPADIVRHGVDGLLVPPDDVGALSAAMRHLMTAPADRTRLASRAVEVVERFSLESVTRRWNDLLSTCCAGSC